MKNNYEFRGNITAIFLSGNLETLIDTKDLPLVQQFPNTWFKHSHCCKCSWRVIGYFYENRRKKRQIFLHRYIMNAPIGYEVDHIDHDSLNNCRSNLRAVTKSINQLNRIGAQRNNKSSGLRGVSYRKDANVWEGYFWINNKRYHVGFFKTKEKAYVTTTAKRNLCLISMGVSVADLLDDTQAARLDVTGTG